MSLEGRLKDLALFYGMPVDNVVSMYSGRYNAIFKAYGPEYVGRDSHLRVHAFRGTEMALDYASKHNTGRLNK